jgi:hypothetical protein
MSSYTAVSTASADCASEPLHVDVARVSLDDGGAANVRGNDTIARVIAVAVVAVAVVVVVVVVIVVIAVVVVVVVVVGAGIT